LQFSLRLHPFTDSAAARHNPHQGRWAGPFPGQSIGRSQYRLFVNDYRNAKPRTEYGNIVFRDILTKLEASRRIRPAEARCSRHSRQLCNTGAGATSSGRAPRVWWRSSSLPAAKANHGQLKSYELKDGVGFTLRPTSISKCPARQRAFGLLMSGRSPVHPTSLPVQILVVRKPWDTI